MLLRKYTILVNVVIFHLYAQAYFCMVMTFCSCRHLFTHFKLLLICEQELLSLDLCLNHNKSVCIHVGPRFNDDCVKLTTCNGHEHEWVNACRYLRVFLLLADHSNVVGKSVKPAFTALLTLYSIALVDTLRLKQLFNCYNPNICLFCSRVWRPVQLIPAIIHR